MGYRTLSSYLFGEVAEKLKPHLLFVKDWLKKADMKIPFKTFLSIALMTSFLTYLISLILLIIFFPLLNFPLFIKIFLVVFLPVLLSLVTFVIIIFFPQQRAISRASDIEANLPFLITHMGSIAASGVPPTMIFKLISEFEEYGEVTKEMKKIVRNIETFGVNPLTAIKSVADRTPSKQLRELLYGFTTTIESGGDIKIYLKTTGQQFLFEWRMKRERFLQQLSTYAEIYTGIIIAAPLFLVSLFAVMGMISPTLAGYSILDLMKLSVYGFIPVVNTIFLLFLKGVEVRV